MSEAPMTRRGQRRAPRASHTWRLSVPALIAAILALAGMLVLAYPTVAAWISQYNQSQLISDYSVNVDHVQPAASTQLAKAHAYNAALNSGALLEANEHLPTGDGTTTDESFDYNTLLRADATGLMARVKIPSIGVDLPVFHGTAEHTLLQGVGHLEGTSLPVGGFGTRSVLTAHRGLANATMFTNLNEVVIGDTFTVEVFGDVLTYRVISTKVVEPDESDALRPEEGRDLATLVTCTPLGINSHRILVTGERLIPTPVRDVEAVGATPNIPGFPWWIPALTLGTVLIGVYLWRSGLRTVPTARTDGDTAQSDADSTELDNELTSNSTEHEPSASA